MLRPGSLDVLLPLLFVAEFLGHVAVRVGEFKEIARNLKRSMTNDPDALRWVTMKQAP
jgi:hypothetical protein